MMVQFLDIQLSGDARNFLTIPEHQAAIYACASGLPMLAPHFSALTENASFSAAVIDCGEPGEVLNANRLGNVFTEGAIVTYTCIDNCFTGGGPITCLPTGFWSTPRPTCVGECFAFKMQSRP